MPEPLKNMFSRPFLESFAGEVQSVRPDFPVRKFLTDVFDAGWDALELKQRVRHISRSLRTALPEDYEKAVGVLVQITERRLAREGEQMSFLHIFLPDFVETFGLDHPDVSLPALETLTRWSSAEFAVRPFLIRFPEKMYVQMLAWSRHSSPMVRRLSSEGFRPRLPWGMGVPALKRDPSPILPVLENLKHDPSETVRRSVANNLNDIAKDHPALVLDIVRRWQGHSTETDWVVRHASRGLLKKGHAEVLAHFGFEQGVQGITVEHLQCSDPERIGGTLEFSFSVKNEGATPTRIRLEYGIDYLTGSGKTSTKVFKIKEMTLAAGQFERVLRRQRFTDFTTRKHYSGAHRLRILVNGQALAEKTFAVV